MPFLTLTPDQKAIVKPQLDQALEAYKDGDKGAILGQIYEDNTGRVMCHCGFVPHSVAARIYRILERGAAQEG